MMKRIFFLFIFSAALSSCARAPEDKAAAPSHTCPGYSKNNMGQSLKWTAGFPIKMWIDPGVPSEHRNAIVQAVNQWNAQFEVQVFAVTGILPEASSAGADGKNVIYWMQEWKVNSESNAAHTQVRWKDAGIYESDILINGQGTTFSNQLKSNQFDLQTVMQHELGHVLGLDHSSEPNSLMQTHLPDGTRKVASKEDLQRLKCAYPNL